MQRNRYKSFIYFTVGWSSNDAENNLSGVPEIKTDLLSSMGKSLVMNLIKKICAFLLEINVFKYRVQYTILTQVEELCENYLPNGFWFDIYQVHRLCYCDQCKLSVSSLNIDLEDTNAVQAHNTFQIKRHCRELRKLIHHKIPDADIFFNGTTSLDKGANFYHQMYSSNTSSLEDLPTTWGSYDKLPMQAKFFLNAGYSITAMSGKFIPNGENLGLQASRCFKYEATSMIASGPIVILATNCIVVMDSSTYENISHAYDYVEKIEAYGVGGKPISKLGLWRSFDQDADEGISKILLEKQVDFDVANCCEN